MKTKIEIDAITGEEIVSEMSSEEIAALEEIALRQAEIKAEQDARASARESALAKLAALGLTEAEIAAL